MLFSIMNNAIIIIILKFFCLFEYKVINDLFLKIIKQYR